VTVSQDRTAAASRALCVKEILAKSAEYFAGKGIDTARLDAERLTAEVLGVDRMELYLEPDRIVKDDERDRLRELVRRRGAREPAQYILGTAGFYGMDLKVDPRALIPRRETELLVDRAREIAGGRQVRVLDIGTGSGCVALALAKHVGEGSEVHATDVSVEALALARENAEAQGLSSRVTFHEGDLFDALGDDAGRFDVIVANLPYVESGEMAGLMPEVREHEPASALDGGEDGLDVVRRCVVAAGARLADGAWLLLEIGATQGPAVVQLMKDAGLEPGDVLTDAENRPRVAQAGKGA
jgi:release factor glutamine methyltransferase